MKVLFKLDRRGEGIHTTFEHELIYDEGAREVTWFIPGLEDIIRIQTSRALSASSATDPVVVPRLVYKRSFEIDKRTGEVIWTIYADEPMTLLRRRRDERIEERAKADLWRGPRPEHPETAKASA